MRKIAIFASGDGECARRVISLFKGGDRISVELVVTDRENSGVVAGSDSIGAEVVYLPREKWHDDSAELLALLRDRGVELIALDEFRGVMPENVASDYDGKIVTLSSPEDAPREIVRAFEMEMSPVEVKSPQMQEERSVDEEWADALKMDYDASRVRETPPPVPGVAQENPVEEAPVYGSARYYGNNQASPCGEPIPPSYLIWSVLATVICCLVPGVVAIIYSSQVSSKYYAGDIEGARKASERAQIWIIVSFVLGVLSSTLYLPFMLISA